MTRQPHDQFAKQYLEELLSPLGNVEISREVTEEVRQVDVFFAPAPSPEADPQILGLLGRIAASACLLEPFRNQPSKTEIRNCMLKLFSLFGELQRKARRENTSLSEDDLPRLWILATSASAALLDSFGARLDPDDWLNGVYFLADSLKTAVVAINQLPSTSDTLWLRILGRGETQRQAIAELLALPQEQPLRRNVLELLSSWRVSIETQETLTEDDREIIMNLSPVYVQRLEEVAQQGRQEGSLGERRLAIENLLKIRFGSLDEELSRVIEPMLELPPEEYIRLSLQLSREELLARFGTSRN